MNQAGSNLADLLASLEPELHPGVYVFCVVPVDADLRHLVPVATVREPEGLTVVLPEAQAIQAGLRAVFRAAWITLNVHSDLQAVGLTAAFSGALGQAGISCNVVAGVHHDHVFVPAESARKALSVLQALQRAQRG